MKCIVLLWLIASGLSSDNREDRQKLRLVAPADVAFNNPDNFEYAIAKTGFLSLNSKWHRKLFEAGVKTKFDDKKNDPGTFHSDVPPNEDLHKIGNKNKKSSTKTEKRCRCGGTDHLRTNHHACPLNQDERWTNDHEIRAKLRAQQKSQDSVASVIGGE